jgi:hypothetical protein
MESDMDYEEMNDFEVNSVVAERLGMNCNDLDDKDSPAIIIGSLDAGFFRIVDYCNVANDAWPIILENRIETGWSSGEVWLATATNQGKPGAFRRFQAYDKNPLRAAMIVFLKMKAEEG